MPNIKWLKKIEYEAPASASTAGKYPDIIDVGNEKFVVIQKSSADDVISTMQPGKRWCFLCISMWQECQYCQLYLGEYVNELEISQAEESDAGMYYCFVTNVFGFKYKNAYLEVIPNKKFIHPTSTTTPHYSSPSWDSNSTYI